MKSFINWYLNKFKKNPGQRPSAWEKFYGSRFFIDLIERIHFRLLVLTISLLGSLNQPNFKVFVVFSRITRYRNSRVGQNVPISVVSLCSYNEKLTISFCGIFNFEIKITSYFQYFHQYRIQCRCENIDHNPYFKMKIAQQEIVNFSLWPHRLNNFMQTCY